VARREERDGVPTYVLDIRLQGEGETVFFDI
ncbi:protocatechuate 3,4-dioxygenase subunit alpha, partial [Roseomonas sp. GCM10028921]